MAEYSKYEEHFVKGMVGYLIEAYEKAQKLPDSSEKNAVIALISCASSESMGIIPSDLITEVLHERRGPHR